MSGRILVVDDDMFCRESIARYLSVSGFLVDTAADGRDALIMCSDRTYRCVLCDYHVPDMSIQKLVGDIRDADPDTELVVMTGDLSAETERAARRLSPAFFFFKPMELRDLCSVMENVCRNSPHVVVAQMQGET